MSQRIGPATSDQELILAIQAGDRSAAATLYERHLPGVWRYVRLRLASDRQTAEDITSETFLAAFRSVGAFDPRRGTVYAWLLGIARNKLGDHLRRVVCTEVSTPFVAEAQVDSGGPDKALCAAEAQDAVIRALGTLPDEERLALEWKYVEGLSVREIAGRLGRTEKAIEALLYRARRSFRARYARGQSE